MSDIRAVRDIVGSAHVAGKYNFTDGDYLNEGADVLLGLGSRVGKFWLVSNPAHYYRFNHDWPEPPNLVDTARTPYFRKLFAKPFTTFVLEALSARGASFAGGPSPEGSDYEREQFYELTKYLLTAYRGTGKTFVLQNWESDWLLTNPQFTKEPDAKTIRGMIDWFNVRQEGVDRAREEVGMDGVTVAHAAEANLIDRAMKGITSATNDVFAHTHCDLYAYSAYDTSLQSAELFRRALDYLRDKTPPSELYGRDNIFVGEFGCPENEFPDFMEIIQRTVETALDWGARYILYWEVFCNEPSREYEGRPSNDDQRGFWLVRPDGSKSPVYDYFAGLCR